MQRSVSALLCAVVIAMAGCGPASTPTAPTAPLASPGGSSPAPATSAPSPTVTGTPAPTVMPRPSGSLAWPTQATIELEAARYFSAPPFSIPFTVEVPEAGWYSGHLHEEFFDLMRFDGVPTDGLPTRIIGFQAPLHVRGADGDVPVAGLTPDEAVDLLTERSSLALANREDVELSDLEGVRVDVRSSVGNNPTFGGEAGDLGVGGELTTRMIILERGEGLMVVIVVALPDDLEAAWRQAQDILATVDLVA